MHYAADPLTNLLRPVPVVNSPQPDSEYAFMPHPSLVALSISLLIAAAPSPAAGQTIPSSYTFIEHSQEWALFAGKSAVNPGQLELGPQDATAVGGRYGVAFGGAMSLDITGTMFISERDVLDVSRPVDDRVLGRSEISIALIDIRLRLNLTGQRAWHGLQPFIAFGGGAAYASSTDRNVEALAALPDDEWYSFGTRFAATLAAGGNFHVSDKISIRLEGVMNLWKIAAPVGWLTVEADPDGENPKSEWVAAKTLTLGAAWRL